MIGGFPMTSSIQNHFSRLEDPRVERNQGHGVMDMLLPVIGAVTRGGDGWEAIEEFGQAKLPWRCRFARFANGVPSHACIASLVSRLSVNGKPASPAT